MDSRLRQKTWGETRQLFLSHETQLEEAILLPGGRSSLHLHRTKSNTFIVTETGTLTITEYGAGAEPTAEPTKTVSIGQDGNRREHTVMPHVWHRMKANTFVRVYELYHKMDGGSRAPIDPDEIERHDMNAMNYEACIAYFRGALCVWRCCRCKEITHPGQEAVLIENRNPLPICTGCVTHNDLKDDRIKAHGGAAW